MATAHSVVSQVGSQSGLFTGSWEELSSENGRMLLQAGKIAMRPLIFELLSRHWKWEEHRTQVEATMQISQAGMAAMAGDSGPGLEQIFLGHKDLVFRAAYRIMGNASDAEDVLQTVFLRLARHENVAAISNLKAYLHRSAVNAALDLLRNRKDRQTVSLDVHPEDPQLTTLGSAARTTELRDWLRQALARLNPRWAEMFVLRFVEDFSNREIAGMMNTSPAVVAVVLHRTRAHLKKDFKSVEARGTR